MYDALDKGWPPSVTPASPPPIPHDDGQDPMDSDNDDGDNQRDNDVIEMDANEARMDLTDDLLHKVGSHRVWDVSIPKIAWKLWTMGCAS